VAEPDPVVAAHVAVAGDRVARSERNVERSFWAVALTILLATVLTAGYVIASVGDTARQHQLDELRRTVERNEATANAIRDHLNTLSQGLGRAHEAQLECLRTGESCDL
jgi:septal ring factor EnvC (AmiA/AmiB activator)